MFSTKFDKKKLSDETKRNVFLPVARVNYSYNKACKQKDIFKTRNCGSLFAKIHLNTF